MMHPRHFTTARLLLRAPVPSDAPEIFDRYASDEEATRYMAWPRHRALQQSENFVAWSEANWQARGVGTYLAFSLHDGTLLGSTGIDVEAPGRASTGYILARDVWGQGFASEMLHAMVARAFADPAIYRLYATCHVAHTASARVLEKGGFTREGVLRRYLLFPNLDDTAPCDVACYARVRV